MVMSDPLNILAESIGEEIGDEIFDPYLWLNEHYVAMNWTTFCDLVGLGRTIYDGTKIKDIIEKKILKPFSRDVILQCRRTGRDEIIGYFDLMIRTSPYPNLYQKLQPFFVIEIKGSPELRHGKAWLKKKD